MAECTTYKQGMKSLGYAPDEEDMNEPDGRTRVLQRPGHQDRCEMFFCIQEGHFRMDCPLFWEAVKIKVIRNTS